MLVLARRLNEKLVLPAIDTTVQMVAVQGGLVRLGIEAPREVVVLREEVYQPAARDEADADARLSQIKDVLRERLTSIRLHLDQLQGQAEQQLTATARANLGHLTQLLAQAFQQLEAATGNGGNLPKSSLLPAPNT